MKGQAERLSTILLERSVRAFEVGRECMQREHLESKQVHDASKYYMEHWHNIIHPGLISLTGEATRANPDAILQAQVAMLLLTAAFDIHDDIIDQSSAKNGKPTVFGKFGKDIALLMGNAFLVKGFTALHGLGDFVPAAKVKEIFNVAQQAFFKIGDAHALEISVRGHEDVPINEYWHIVEMKASALQADAKIGAVLSSATRGEIEALATYGYAIGELEILRDDFIDVFEAEELYNRLKNECPPLPILYAFQNKKTKKKIQGTLRKKMSQEDTDVDLVVDMMFETREVKQLLRKMRHIVDQAVNCLSTLDDSAARTTLRELALSMLEGLNE
jgi:geranylgeranyl diphosphate synthase type II